MNKISFTFRSIFLFTTLQFAASEDYCATCAEDTLQEQYGEIIYAALIFRHGDRVPEKFYPTDPYANYSWPSDLGQLLNTGKQRAYNLGKFMRPRYKSLVGKKFSPSQYIMHASSYDRTLMSGMLFNAGFFPPTDDEVWNSQSDLHWQPIPVRSAPPEIDNVLLIDKKPCPRRDVLTEDYYKTAKIIEEVCAKYKDEIEFIANKSNYSMTPCRSHPSMWNLMLLQDCLLIEDQQNLTLPEWTKEIYPQPINEIRTHIHQHTDDTSIAKMNVGPLCSCICTDMVNVAGWENYTLPETIFSSTQLKCPKLHSFAAHDINIVVLQRALGVYQNEAPNYSAAMSLELRKKSGNYSVTMAYANSMHEKMQIMKLPNCEEACPLQEFLSIITPLIPEDYEAVCSLNYTEPAENSGKTGSNRKKPSIRSVRLPQ